ncbi:MAG: glucan biosynthesis protein, partial [Gluconacetobacter diazotrophicus]|nr:glucan biosynthesis protein [Gluconacetobacter diazotrophicus]
PTTTGAYRFAIRPGDETVFDVECTVYPRQTLVEPGIAPLTGMFFFDTNDRSRVDDARPAAHDSEGLSIWNGGGEQIWRPLANPVDLQFSAFTDSRPKGFGLMQRKRAFSDYQDLALDYQKRPSLWIEPLGDWGQGAVDLVELPTPNEVNDNIVSFWRPQAPLVAGGEYGWRYRMHWGWDNPWATSLVRVGATWIGATDDHKGRFVMIDFHGDVLAALGTSAKLHAAPGASAGEIRSVVVEPSPPTGGWRVTFEFYPGSARVADLHCALMSDAGPISERWVYRWTP